jgi:hypothetical protein
MYFGSWAKSVNNSSYCEFCIVFMIHVVCKAWVMYARKGAIIIIDVKYVCPHIGQDYVIFLSCLVNLCYAGKSLFPKRVWILFLAWICYVRVYEANILFCVSRFVRLLTSVPCYVLCAVCWRTSGPVPPFPLPYVFCLQRELTASGEAAAERCEWLHAVGDLRPRPKRLLRPASLTFWHRNLAFKF